jgi:hypothetical protein
MNSSCDQEEAQIRRSVVARVVACVHMFVCVLQDNESKLNERAIIATSFERVVVLSQYYYTNNYEGGEPPWISDASSSSSPDADLKNESRRTS